MKKLKRKAEELAIWNGSPAFENFLHVGRPNIGDREKLIRRIDELLDRRWLTNNGAFVQELESKIAKFLQVKHCTLVCNGTIGLEILVHALGWKGEVILPSFTFIATAHALQWLGVKPVFCDIDPQTHNLNPKCVETLITSRTTGILGVHVWGRPAPVIELAQIANKYGLKLAYDAAHAFGCSFRGSMIGSFGEAEVFSFHATKFFNSFEGGAIVTNNDVLAAEVRSMINFGFQGYDNVVSLGINGKMTEVAAAMGLTSLDALDQFIETNLRNYHVYRKELAGIPGVQLISYNENEKNNYQYIIIEIHSEQATLTRDQLNDVLHAENVLSRRYFFPGCHQMEPYRTLYPEANVHLPLTNELASRTLSLPNGTAVTEEDICSICQIIRLAVTNGSEVTLRLNTQ
jgi:dTDP-4-amino-4,6-dideoxygalactose transaminase